MTSFRFLCAAALGLAFAACASAFRDDSRFVRIDDKRGYYILQTGSSLALKLGYKYPPTSDSGDPLHRGYGNDAIAFQFSRTGVLIAPPAYFSQLPPDRSITDRLALVKVGVTTWPEIDRAFPDTNWRIKQPNGSMLIYKNIPIYNPLEQGISTGGR